MRGAPNWAKKAESVLIGQDVNSDRRASLWIDDLVLIYAIKRHWSMISANVLIDTRQSA
jgi:hypothetical protein